MSTQTAQRIEHCLQKYLPETKDGRAALTPETDLISGLGLSSDQGVELVLDLCDAFEFDFPKAFNPLVHPSGRRAMKWGELITTVESMIEGQEGGR